MESRQRRVWHQAAGKRALIRASRNAMRDFVAIPYNARARWLHAKPAAWIKKEVTFGKQKLLLFWWRWWDSNPWPLRRERNALPAELHPHISYYKIISQTLFLSSLFSIFFQKNELYGVKPSLLFDLFRKKAHVFEKTRHIRVKKAKKVLTKVKWYDIICERQFGGIAQLVEQPVHTR